MLPKPTPKKNLQMENFKVTNPSSLDEKHVALGQVIDSMKARFNQVILILGTVGIALASQVKLP
jgi:hypothetical protein